ncbi:hypothetical protein [Aliikangiella maris]|uniref:Uncharacterized protein n=2 Tax=Aliikangiella maris TaxID=3162458 RepID=A0ABV3MQQ8_9GAMM
MQYGKLLILISLSIFALTACQQSSDSLGKTGEKQPTSVNATPKVKQNSSETSDMQPVLNLQGTVKYFSHEGGFFGIITQDGEKLLPINLAEEFKQDNAHIQFNGEKATDVMTVYQWGTPFRVNKAKLIEAGTPPKKAQ